MRLHHVQLAMPPGGEAAARAFFVAALGMVEIPKPASLAARGGAWFRSGSCEIHVGVEADYRPARKAHPGIAVDDIDAVAHRVTGSGHDVQWDDLFPGRRRFSFHDPFGNRIEILGPAKTV